VGQTVQIEYQRGDAAADEIQAVVDEVLLQLANPAGDAAEAARQAGLDPQMLSDVRIDVREGQQGADPVLTPIIIGITVSAGSKIAETLWKDVIWPRLRRRLGTGVLKAPTAEHKHENGGG
jgi:hypothetical protein